MLLVSRPKRKLELKFKVFCEGDTEYNYFDYIRKNKIISLTLNTVNMNGGGYSNFLEEIKQDSNTACIAKFIVIDGDKANTSIEEKKNLENLIDYCITQNESDRTPHILIVDYPDFEYVACLHCPDYKGGSIKQFITKNLKYKSVDDLKADKNIYIKLNNKKYTYKNIISSYKKRNCIIENEFKRSKSTYEIKTTTIYHEDNIGKKGTNFLDFFDVIDALKS